MAIFDGNVAAQEHLLETTKLIAQAVLKSPQMTGRVKIKMEIITGKDLEPMMAALMELGKLEAFNFMSYMAWNTLYRQGTPPVLLLIAADIRTSDLNYDCGACGFPTCGEFNKYSKSVEPLDRYMMQGPMCHWKLMDFSAACSWACAAAWQYNITNRIEAASGMASAAIGYLPECSIYVGLPVGPCEDLYWYSRRIISESGMISHKMWSEIMMMNYPFHYATFPGSGRPEVKAGDRWWENLKHRALKTVDPKELEERAKMVTANLEKIKQKRLGQNS